jgi:hypothetical protein
MSLSRLVVVFLFCFLTACFQTPYKDKMAAADLRDAGVSRLAKSDIDEVIELHQHAVMKDLKQLMIKLYYRNPSQRFDKDKRSVETSVDLVFKRPYYYGYKHWDGLTGSEIIRLALDPDYHVNDRILPLIVGLRKMLMASYENETRFYYLTDLNEQKLYNSARNIEIAAWLLSEKKDEHGQLLLVSDSIGQESRNLSFQRLIGKMIATQDNLASIISFKEGRVVKTVVIKAASMAFLPI